MRYRAPKATNILSLSSMFCALTVICIYLSSVLPVGRVVLYFVSSIFTAGLMVERNTKAAILMYISSSIISLLLVPDFKSVLPYVLLFGHYGIAKLHIEKVLNPVLCWLLKVLYWNICLTLLYFLAGSILGEILMSLPLWTVFLIGNPALLAFDFIYSLFADYYYRNIRGKIIS